MYLWFFSLLLLPVAAACWSRTVLLSTPAREGGRRGLVLAGVVTATAIAAALVLSRLASDLK